MKRQQLEHILRAAAITGADRFVVIGSQAILGQFANAPADLLVSIEADLPIKRNSAHARREKSICHRHIPTPHIWWARRPLVACRGIICAALWPDPADPNCPKPDTVQNPATLAWVLIVRVEHYHVGAEKISSEANRGITNA